MPENVIEFLQYGALGLLALMIVGVGWYVRNSEVRATAREEAERERQRQLDIDARERQERQEAAEDRRQAQWLAAYTKATEAHVSATATLAMVMSKFEAHDARMQEEHRRLQDEHQAIIEACDFPGKGL